MFEKEIQYVEMIHKYLKNAARFGEIKNRADQITQKEQRKKEESEELSKLAMEAITMFLENMAIYKQLDDAKNDR